MSSHRLLLLSLILTLPLCAAACRQPDGPPATEDGEVPGRLTDLARDLQSVAAGDTQAPGDFADDIRVFVRNPANEAAATAFATRVTDAVSGTKLSELAAQQIARSSWIAVGSTELSSRQVEALRADLESQLKAAGAAEAASAAAAAQVVELQKVVTTRTRSWYEMF